MTETVEIKTFGEARKKRYKIFGEEAEAYESAAKYVEHLAHVTDTDISHWPISLFNDIDADGIDADGIDDEPIIHTSRIELNKIFFSLKKNQPPPPANSSIMEITPTELDAVNRLQTHLNRSIDYALKNQKIIHSSSESRCHEYMASLDIERKKFAASSEAIRSLERAKKEKTLVTEALSEILSYKFYTLPLAQPEVGISFLTKPIMLKYFNEEQSATNLVHMGNYEVFMLFAEKNYIRVWPYQDNPVVFDEPDTPSDGAWYHPHVSSVGEVCLGNMTLAMLKAERQMDFAKMLEIIEAVLTNYYDENPFQGLYSFEEAWVAKVMSKNGYLPGEENFNSDTRRSLRLMESQLLEDRTGRGQRNRGGARGGVPGPGGSGRIILDESPSFDLDLSGLRSYLTRSEGGYVPLPDSEARYSLTLNTNSGGWSTSNASDSYFIPTPTIETGEDPND